jgi:hypothetical protein
MCEKDQVLGMRTTRGEEWRLCVTAEASLDGISLGMINENRDLRYNLKMNIDGLIMQGV